MIEPHQPRTAGRMLQSVPFFKKTGGVGIDNIGRCYKIRIFYVEELTGWFGSDSRIVGYPFFNNSRDLNNAKQSKDSHSVVRAKRII